MISHIPCILFALESWLIASVAFSPATRTTIPKQILRADKTARCDHLVSHRGKDLGASVCNDSRERTDHWKSDLSDRLYELHTYMKSNRTFADGLLYSLDLARSNGARDLAPDLFQAFLLDGVNGWPTNTVFDKGDLSYTDSYFRYLEWFASYVPQQSDYHGWMNGTQQDYYSTHQELLDRCCHFYFLINQELIGSNGATLQNDEFFSQWLVRYAQVWGKFCNSPDSISPRTMYSFYKNAKKYNLTDSMIPINQEDIPNPPEKFTIYNELGQPLRPNSPSGWMSWNQLFARELNPGLRPIDSPSNNSILCAPTDCTFKATYPISDTNEVMVKSGDTNKIKRTHSIGSIGDLLKGSKYSRVFEGGTYVHYFLGPYSYHRFHTPVAGEVKESFPIPGLAYLDVDIKDGHFDADDDSTNGYEFWQARGLITIDTTNSPYGNVGIVAVIPIGMAQVSSVSMTATPGTDMPKGSEFGYFQFGGSDIIMLFQKDKVQKLFQEEHAYNHYGTQIGELYQTKTQTTTSFLSTEY